MEPPGIRALLDYCLGIKNTEKVALLYDTNRKAVRRILEAGLSQRRCQYKSIALEHENGSYTQDALDILENPDYPVIIFTSVKSIWHHPARKRAKYELGKRVVSVICEAQGFQNGYSAADPEQIEQLGTPISRLFVPGATVRITTISGTDIESVIESPFLETGMFQQRSTGGNWPSGEVGFGPKEGSVNGTIVYDLKFKHLGSLQKHHARVKVVEDECVEFDDKGGRRLRELFISRDNALMMVGEFAVGLNPGFGRDRKNEIVMDSDATTIVEEKALGTAHFGHGGNLSFGKRVGDHADGVVSSPTVTVNGQMIMKDGKLSRKLYSDDICKWLGEIGLLHIG